MGAKEVQLHPNECINYLAINRGEICKVCVLFYLNKLIINAIIQLCKAIKDTKTAGFYQIPVEKNSD
ncbi:hypothetical protein [Mucilaginibacter mallensis]|uniref:hypothetical protein n=1 Tax=Mucilaginibacter mallensis TaxID=652787 RepID=UPI000B858CF2|nr:hypothetical protein [Mucilaginibacter mallensis]